MTDTKTPSPSDAELLPCPFCGSKEATIADDLITFYGECLSCGATAGHSSYRDGAVFAWNRRTPQPAPVREPMPRRTLLDMTQCYSDRETFGRAVEEWHGITANSGKGDSDGKPPTT